MVFVVGGLWVMPRGVNGGVIVHSCDGGRGIGEEALGVLTTTTTTTTVTHFLSRETNVVTSTQKHINQNSIEINRKLKV